MKTESIKTSKTAKVCISGDLATAENVWIVLHGYGQLAQYFIRKFHPLLEKNICVIAPEGFSRFYVEGFSGRVGASWMTKEEREIDIQDYIHYLNDVYQHYSLKDKKVTLLGFSQGGATASRWYQSNPNNFDKFLLWCSVFPPDFDMSSITLDHCTIVVGKEDPFMRNESYQNIEKLIQTEENLKVNYFNGGHDIDAQTLLNFVD